MDAKTADTIRADAAAEIARRERPSGFPDLPPVPAARYRDPAFFALEQQYVFRREWLFAALATEIPSCGDRMAVDHLPAPIFLARGADGEIRAFYNSCRHRGSRLVDEGRSCADGRRIVCPYHAWSYELTGELRSVSEPRDFGEVDRSTLGLHPVRCETWAGMTFVNFDAEAAPLRRALGRVADELDDEFGDGAPDTEVHLLRKCAWDVECNWKLGVDANLETYHVNSLHRATASNVIDQKSTTIELFGGGQSRMFLHSRPEAQQDLPVPKFPRAGALGGEGVLTYGIFPNVALVVSPYLLFTTNAWPVGPTRTRYEVYFMGAAPASEETQATWDFVLGFNVSVIEEDVAMLRGIQQSIDGGGMREMRLSYQERRIYQMHEEIDRRIGTERVPAGLAVPRVLPPPPAD